MSAADDLIAELGLAPTAPAAPSAADQLIAEMGLSIPPPVEEFDPTKVPSLQELFERRVEGLKAQHGAENVTVKRVERFNIAEGGEAIREGLVPEISFPGGTVELSELISERNKLGIVAAKSVKQDQPSPVSAGQRAILGTAQSGAGRAEILRKDFGDRVFHDPQSDDVFIQLEEGKPPQRVDPKIDVTSTKGLRQIAATLLGSVAATTGLLALPAVRDLLTKISPEAAGDIADIAAPVVQAAVGTAGAAVGGAIGGPGLAGAGGALVGGAVGDLIASVTGQAIAQRAGEQIPTSERKKIVARDVAIGAVAEVGRGAITALRPRTLVQAVTQGRPFVGKDLLAKGAARQAEARSLGTSLSVGEATGGRFARNIEGARSSLLGEGNLVGRINQAAVSFEKTIEKTAGRKIVAARDIPLITNATKKLEKRITEEMTAKADPLFAAAQKSVKGRATETIPEQVKALKKINEQWGPLRELKAEGIKIRGGEVLASPKALQTKLARYRLAANGELTLMRGQSKKANKKMGRILLEAAQKDLGASNLTELKQARKIWAEFSNLRRQVKTKLLKTAKKLGLEDGLENFSKASLTGTTTPNQLRQTAIVLQAADPAAAQVMRGGMLEQILKGAKAIEGGELAKAGAKVDPGNLARALQKHEAQLDAAFVNDRAGFHRLMKLKRVLGRFETVRTPKKIQRSIWDALFVSFDPLGRLADPKQVDIILKLVTPARAPTAKTIARLTAKLVKLEETRQEEKKDFTRWLAEPTGPKAFELAPGETLQ